MSPITKYSENNKLNSSIYLLMDVLHYVLITSPIIAPLFFVDFYSWMHF